MEKSLNRVIYIIIILALIAINVGVYIHFNKKETSSNKEDLTENNIEENTSTINPPDHKFIECSKQAYLKLTTCVQINSQM